MMMDDARLITICIWGKGWGFFKAMFISNGAQGVSFHSRLASTGDGFGCFSCLQELSLPHILCSLVPCLLSFVTDICGRASNSKHEMISAVQCYVHVLLMMVQLYPTGVTSLM